MSNLFLFTTGTNLDLLQESCQHHGLTLHNYECKWTGYVSVKVRAAIQFLASKLTYATEEAVMWVDGNDSLIVQPESVILARWQSMGCPLVIAAERNCWPDAELASQYPEAPDPKYLNAGGYIGTKADVLHALHMVNRHAETEDDQREWTRMYLKHMLPQLHIDHARHIFASVGDGDEARDADSCVKHWNGKVPGRSEYWENVKDYMEESNNWDPGCAE